MASSGGLRPRSQVPSLRSRVFDRVVVPDVSGASRTLAGWFNPPLPLCSMPCLLPSLEPNGEKANAR